MRAEIIMSLKNSVMRVLVATGLLTAVAVSGWGFENTRPEIVVSDPDSGCPSVAGSFVVLLNASRGMLILSGAPFLGGHVAGDARGGEMTISVPGAAAWKLASAGSDIGQTPLWAARYPFLAASGNGCVGFDRDHWSSEGDLVTYVRWLVEEVYLELPPEVRQRRPDLRMADREVSLRIERDGYGPVELSGKEGSTLACRYADSQRLYLFIPFVLDEAAGSIAVKVATTDGSYFDTESKSTIGWAVASADQPGALADTTIVVSVEGIE
jgi:hypothetical protein